MDIGKEDEEAIEAPVPGKQPVPEKVPEPIAVPEPAHALVVSTSERDGWGRCGRG